MTEKGHKNHYNVKFLNGYGLSVKLKDNKIILKNGYNPFSNEQEQEEWFITQLPYEKIVLSGKGYISTEALGLLNQNYRNVILVDNSGNPISMMNGCMQSLTGTKYRIGQYDTFRDSEKCNYLGKQTIKAKLESQIRFLKSFDDSNEIILKLQENLDEINLEKFERLEHTFARHYWAYYTTLFDPRHNFISRNQSSQKTSKQKASDPINALLNYGYAVLAGEITKYVCGFGLDPYFGYMHKQNSGSIPLVYDLMEPFRWLVEKAVYNIANTSSADHKLRFKDYAWTKDGQVVLSYRIKKNFLEKLERIFQKERDYECRFGKSKKNGLKSCQEITIVRIAVQNLADYCISKSDKFAI